MALPKISALRVSSERKLSNKTCVSFTNSSFLRIALCHNSTFAFSSSRMRRAMLLVYHNVTPAMVAAKSNKITFQRCLFCNTAMFFAYDLFARSNKNAYSKATSFKASNLPDLPPCPASMVHLKNNLFESVFISRNFATYFAGSQYCTWLSQ